MNANVLKRYIEISELLGLEPSWEELKRFELAEESFKDRYNITLM